MQLSAENIHFNGTVVMTHTSTAFLGWSTFTDLEPHACFGIIHKCVLLLYASNTCFSTYGKHHNTTCHELLRRVACVQIHHNCHVSYTVCLQHATTTSSTVCTATRTVAVGSKSTHIDHKHEGRVSTCAINAQSLTPPGAINVVSITTGRLSLVALASHT